MRCFSSDLSSGSKSKDDVKNRRKQVLGSEKFSDLHSSMPSLLVLVRASKFSEECRTEVTYHISKRASWRNDLDLFSHTNQPIPRLLEENPHWIGQVWWLAVSAVELQSL